MSLRELTALCRLHRCVSAVMVLLACNANGKTAEFDVVGFRRACAELAADGDSMAVTGKDGWLFLRSELRHIGAGDFWGDVAAKVSRATSAKTADPLPAIVDFNGQLKASGIELILMPVPCKAVIYPDKLVPVQKAPDSISQRLDTVHQQFYAKLRDNGVIVLDLTDVFLKEKGDKNVPPLYCKTDTHWSPYACEVAARVIKEVIGSPPWLKGDHANYSTHSQTRTIRGDLVDGGTREQVPARVVEATNGTMEDKSSPILLLGDSHTLVFHAGADLQGTGAGLADQLAAELGMPVDIVGVRGSGATPARVNLMRRARSDSDYLASKKVVIWCFAAREFTESAGWVTFKLAP